MKERRRFGVYPHAVWTVTDHTTGDGHPTLTGGGLVVREISPGVPYSRMAPLKIYSLRHAACAYADQHDEQGNPLP